MTTDAASPSSSPSPPPPSLGPVPEPEPRAPAFPTAPPTAAPRLADTSGLAIGAIVLAALLGLCFAASSASAIWLAAEMPPGGTADNAPLLPLGTYGLATVLVLPVGLAAWLVTGFWAMRVRSNAEVLSPTTHHKRRRGWGMWGWITPIVSLWFPYQYLRDVRRASGATSGDSRVGLWWAGWLVVVIGSRIESSTTDRLLEGENAGGAVSVFATVGIAAVVLSFAMWVVVVRAVERGQAAQAREILR